MTVKQQLRQLADDLPDDASFEQVMERLYLLYKIQRGELQADAGQTISQEEVRRRIEAKWRK